MSKETITLNYPISYADLKHLKEGDEVTITWRNTPEPKSSVTLTGEVGKTDIGTMHVHVDAPWVSTVGLTWYHAGDFGVADTINRPDINVTIPRPEPLHATVGAVLLGPRGEVAVGGKIAAGVARVVDEDFTVRSRWTIIRPYADNVERVPHKDSWVLRSWKRVDPLEPVEDEDWIDLDY